VIKEFSKFLNHVVKYLLLAGLESWNLDAFAEIKKS